MNKLLTIVVPTYNMEKYLHRCLGSLIIEDEGLFNKLEVIVINDGSKDSSSTIAHEYQNKYPNVFRIIDKENGNYGSCVNRGLLEAKGKYFRLLDADDWFDTKALKIFISFLTNINVDFVLTNYRMVNWLGETIRLRYVSLGSDEMYFDNVCFVGSKNEHLLAMHSITYKLDLLKKSKLNHQEGISYTDIEYCFYPLTIAKSFYYLNVVLYQYFVGREGQTVSRESSVSHLNDYYLVAARALMYFSNVIGNMTTNRKMSLSRLLFNPVDMIYRITLVYQREMSDNDVSLLNRMECLLRNHYIIKKMLVGSTYKKIPFFWLWKHLKIRLGLFMICQ